jgi:hypothetical protein
MDDDIYRKGRKSTTRLNRTEDSDTYGYNDSNTNRRGEVDGLPMQASDLDNIITGSIYRRKKIKKPKIKRKPKRK